MCLPANIGFTAKLLYFWVSKANFFLNFPHPK